MRILQTAMPLFTEHGIKAVKMDDIATALSISKRTLYEIYDDKESLLQEGIRFFQQKHRNRLETAASGKSNVMEIILEMYRINIERISRVNPVFYSDIEKYPRILKSLDQDKESRKQQFFNFMQRGVDEGYFRPDVNYNIVSFMFDALGKYMMEMHLYEKYPIKELYLNMLFVSLRGFCTTKGIEILDKAI